MLDRNGRATRAGAEVRVYRAGTQRLIGSGLVDAGSGYNAQSDLPVHIGLGNLDRVDVQVTIPAGARRSVAWQRAVFSARTRTIIVRVP